MQRNSEPHSRKSQIVAVIASNPYRAVLSLEAGNATPQWGALQTAAPSVAVELRSIDVRAFNELERAIIGFAQGANAGLIVSPSPSAFRYRELIITLAARHNLPTIYPCSFFVTAGGLASYGPNTIDPYRQAASYVDRILKGEKPADLPVQAPTKYELVINLKTAKALGLTVPPALLARADNVIE